MLSVIFYFNMTRTKNIYSGLSTVIETKLRLKLLDLSCFSIEFGLSNWFNIVFGGFLWLELADSGVGFILIGPILIQSIRRTDSWR